tara:strand:+ start:519 stop:1295 length:777 start_codon:yes stop_codon:yes gene_type:complete
MEIIFFPLTFEFKYLIVVSTSGNSGMISKNNSNQYNITDIFENVSHAKYDLMNDIMSLGIHRLWKKYFVDLVLSKHTDDENILDIASGSGDIFNLLPIHKNLYAVDPISEMHNISRKKNSSKKIDYQVGYAEDLPYKKNFFKTITCTYGVRNFNNRKDGFAEIYRCLKKNGYFFIMEFGIPKRNLLKKPYKNFLKYILPFTGSIVSNDRHSYKYLAESIISFPSQINFVKELINAGFSHVKTIDFISGANSIYIVQKK